MTQSGHRIPRRSQEQRSAETRLRLLDATIDCLVEFGYAGTTSPRIADKSGVTRGAQVHHFGTKDELVLAAINYLAEQRMKAALSEIDAFDKGTDPLDALLDLLWDIHTGPIFDATVELWVASRTDPQLATEMAKFESKVNQALHSAAARFLPPSVKKEAVDFVYTAMDVIRGIRVSSFVDGDSSRARRRWDRAAANLRRIAGSAIVDYPLS